jgi:hypothetical protein
MPCIDVDMRTLAEIVAPASEAAVEKNQITSKEKNLNN